MMKPKDVPITGIELAIFGLGNRLHIDSAKLSVDTHIVKLRAATLYRKYRVPHL